MLPSVALPATPPALPYQPKLMGFRAVAVGLVVLGHWNWALIPFPLNELGLQPLIVLSGYLISGIIWKNNIRWDSGANGRRALGVFYFRRFLRIVPPYYLSLALGALLPLATLHQYPLWFVLPLANILCYQLRSWPEGVGHYWTTALEIQFYIVWPLLLGLLQRRQTLGLWLLVALGLGYRAYQAFYVVPAAPVYSTVLLPSCFDLFALGALVQLHAKAPAVSLPAAALRGWLVVWAGLGWGLLWVLTQRVAAGEQLWALLSPSVGAVVSCLVLYWLQLPTAGRWLAHPLAQWVGERSYGIYLFHLMLPVFYQRFVFHFTSANSVYWRPWLMNSVVMSMLLLPLVFTLSTLSWHYLEAPLARWKTRYA